MVRKEYPLATVTALRSKAAKVADAELARLAGRLKAAGVSASTLDEASQAVRRVVDKLLLTPTLTVELPAGSPDGEEYAAALRVLFDLDPPISAAADDGNIHGLRHRQARSLDAQLLPQGRLRHRQQRRS